MSNNRSYLKKYLTYSLQFLLAFELMMFCSSLAMTQRQEAMVRFVEYQFTFVSLGGVFFLLLLLFRAIKKDTYAFYFLFYGCFIFLATISDMGYPYYQKDQPHYELMTMLSVGLTRSSYFCMIIVASYTMLKKYINNKWSEKWRVKNEERSYYSLFTIHYSLFIIHYSLLIIH